MTDLLAAVRQLKELAEKATLGPWELRDETGILAQSPEWAGPQLLGSIIPAENAELVVAAVNLVGPLIEDWERRGRIEEAARRVVVAAIEHEDDPTAESARTLKAITKQLDVALAGVGEP